MATIDILSPVGRIVTGHPRKPRDLLEDDGKTKKLKDGKPIPQYFFGFAIPKAEWAVIANAMGAAATGVPGNNLPDFAWKFKDGDTGVDGEGKPLNLKPGHAGCMILAISTQISDFIKVYRRVDAATWSEMGPEEINCGDYVRVRLAIEGHGKKPGVPNSKAGLYINPMGVEFVGYGERIFSGVDAKGMFGDAPAAVLPAGASATPVAAATSVAMPSPTPQGMAPAPAPVMPGSYPAPVAPSPLAPIAPAVAPIVPAPVAAPVLAPTVSPINPAPAPHPGFVQAAIAPVAPVVPAGPPVVGYDPATGRPIYGYTLDASGKNWPIFGYDAAGQPIYQ